MFSPPLKTAALSPLGNCSPSALSPAPSRANRWMRRMPVGSISVGAGGGATWPNWAGSTAGSLCSGLSGASLSSLTRARATAPSGSVGASAGGGVDTWDVGRVPGGPYWLPRQMKLRGDEDRVRARVRAYATAGATPGTAFQASVEVAGRRYEVEPVSTTVFGVPAGGWVWVRRGGDWTSAENTGADHRTHRRAASPPDRRTNTIGFRCAKDAK